MFPEHLRLQIKESDTALSNPKVKITFELDERASEIFQRRLHIKHYQNVEQVLGELCLINAENQLDQNHFQTKRSQPSLFTQLLTETP